MNEQEKFWSKSFGDKYTKRQPAKTLLISNIVFFSKVLKKYNIKSLIELGANNGSNIIAIKKIKKKLKNLVAVEINKNACKNLEKISNLEVINKSIVNLEINKKFDLVLLKGVLIHINPKQLKSVYEKISNLSSKYILFAEYYNPYPVKITYRGNKNKLFKRDFAGEFIKKYKKFKIIDYGFIYKRDKYPQDDLTWFLIKKK